MLLSWLATGWPAAALLGGVLGALLPRRVQAHRLARRQAERADALAEAAAALRDAVRAGHGLHDALVGLARYGPPPLRAEVARLVADARLQGLPMALEAFGDRLADPLGDQLARMLLLNHQLGGRNLAPSLDALTAAARAEIRSLREIHARQAEQRLSARVVAATPVLALLAFQASNPRLLAAYDTFLGQLVLLAAGGLIAAGYALMLRLGQPPPGVRLQRTGGTR